MLSYFASIVKMLSYLYPEGAENKGRVRQVDPIPVGRMKPNELAVDSAGKISVAEPIITIVYESM